MHLYSMLLQDILPPSDFYLVQIKIKSEDGELLG